MKFILSIFIIICSTRIFAGADINSYLNNMRSVSIDFTQTDSKGGEAKGTLLINKPYNFRCNYYEPFPLLILGNKNYLVIYDYDMDTTTRINPNENMFNFLLVDEKDLSKYFTLDAEEDLENILKLMLTHIESGKKATLIFDKANKQIKKIKIFEVDNVITLDFAKAQQIQKFDEDLFILKNTNIFGPPKRLDKKALELKASF